MRLSRYFLPILRETPKEAEIVSHRLMLRAGMMRQEAAGIYAFLPLGLRVLDKICRIVREEQNRSGAIELLMPTIQSADLWRESGRYDAYGPEMLRIRDRHDREMLYGPTNEDMITALFRDEVRSYRDLPRMLYHIQWKFRDEVRPRFGVMRGREFLMKDAYSFDLDEAGARLSYYKQMLAYLRTFQRIGIQAVPMKAASGPIGGDLSHEFIVLAPTGESEVFYDAAYDEFDWNQSDLSYGDEAGLKGLFDRVNSTYAATDETHDEARWSKVAEDRKRTGRGIEVGHIFYFGDKYSSAMGLKVSGQDGTPVTPMMGSYGVGVSRLVGAVIEASHDDAGIIWPESVAPWMIGLVNMRHDDPACVAVAEDLYAKLQKFGDVTLYDDREERGGVKLGSMDVIGLPLQFIVGPKSVAEGMIETKNRRSGQREFLPVDRAVEVVATMLPGGAAPVDPRL